MLRAPRTVVLGTRTSSETKAKFAALALQQGLTESALLALLVDKVLAANAAGATSVVPVVDSNEGNANDRVTLRLRPGDRALAEVRAAARGMKTASYLSMLVRTHVRDASVMPPAELEHLKSAAGHLAALGRQLRLRGAGTSSEDGVRELLTDLGATVESVRDAVAGVVRTNLISWEAGHA